MGPTSGDFLSCAASGAASSSPRTARRIILVFTTHPSMPSPLYIVRILLRGKADVSNRPRRPSPVLPAGSRAPEGGIRGGRHLSRFRDAEDRMEQPELRHLRA